MSTTPSLQRGVITNILAATTTGTGAAYNIPINADNTKIEVTGAGTISSGTLILEENLTDPAYSGTWSQLASVTLSTLSGGAKQTYHVAGNMTFIRARVSVNLAGAGGLVSVDAMAD